MLLIFTKIWFVSRNWILGAVAALLVAASPAHAQYLVLDESFAPVTEGYPGVGLRPSFTAYPGGKALVSGPIVNGRDSRYKSVRLDADGNLDLAFPGLSGVRLYLAVYPDGRILYASMVDTSTSTVIVKRVFGDGTLDPTFTPFTISNDFCRAHLLEDERILIYGTFGLVAGVSRKNLALVNADGTLVPEFQSPFAASGSGSLFAVTPTLDGQHLLVAGQSFSFGGGGDQLLRLNLDGSWDPTFVVPSGTFATAVTAIYALEGGASLAMTSGRQIVRLRGDGSVDPTFVAAPVGTTLGFGPRQVDGKIFYITLTTSPSEQQLRRLNPDGSDDTTFAVIATPYGSSYQVDLPVLGMDGTFFVGPLSEESYNGRYMMTRVSGDGVVDPSYKPRFSRYGRIGAFDRQADGKVVIAGALDHINNVATLRPYVLMRLNPNGSIDPSFDTSQSGMAVITQLKVLSSGKIMAVGAFPSATMTNAYGTKCYLADGGEDPNYQPVPYGLRFTAVDRSGRVYGMDGTGVIRRYGADGQLDGSFQVSAQFSGTIRLAPSDDGSLYVSEIPIFGGPRITRLASNGVVNFTINPGQTASLAMGMLPDNSMVVAQQSGINFGVILKLFRLQPDGTLTLHYTSTSYQAGFPNEAIQQDTAAAVLSLLKQISTASDASVLLDLQTEMKMALNCSGNDQAVMLQATYEGSGTRLARYLRSPTNEPGFMSAPLILSVPTSFPSWPVGASLLAYAEVAGLSPFEFQWYRNDQPVSGATGQMLVLSDLQAGDAGNYHLIVTNAHGSATSQIIPVTIDTGKAMASIVTQPSSQAVKVGETATFVVVAAGNPAPHYQWRFNGTPLAGETGASLTIPNAQPANVGIYDVLVGNSVTTASSSFSKSQRSDPVTLILGDPGISQHPESLEREIGASATFSVMAAGTGPFGFQWRKAGQPIAGATAASYTLDSVQADDAGSYDVVVSNFAGDVHSEPATLTISAYSIWRHGHFGPAELDDETVSGFAADPDGDGLPNLLEYALDFSPREVDTAGVPEVSVAEAAWAFTYVRPAWLTELTYEVETSTDLSNWTTAGLVHQRIAVDGDYETWRATRDLEASSQVFFRLKVSKP